jgi:hypothetical protein
LFLSSFFLFFMYEINSSMESCHLH